MMLCERKFLLAGVDFKILAVYWLLWVLRTLSLSLASINCLNSYSCLQQLTKVSQELKDIQFNKPYTKNIISMIIKNQQIQCERAKSYCEVHLMVFISAPIKLLIRGKMKIYERPIVSKSSTCNHCGCWRSNHCDFERSDSGNRHPSISDTNFEVELSILLTPLSLPRIFRLNSFDQRIWR